MNSGDLAEKQLHDLIEPVARFSRAFTAKMRIAYSRHKNGHNNKLMNQLDPKLHSQIVHFADIAEYKTLVKLVGFFDDPFGYRQFLAGPEMPAIIRLAADLAGAPPEVVDVDSVRDNVLRNLEELGGVGFALFADHLLKVSGPKQAISRKPLSIAEQHDIASKIVLITPGIARILLDPLLSEPHTIPFKLGSQLKIRGGDLAALDEIQNNIRELANFCPETPVTPDIQTQPPWRPNPNSPWRKGPP